MDPQGRLLLEQTGLALGDARARAAAPVPPGAGVYVGVMHMEYMDGDNSWTVRACFQRAARCMSAMHGPGSMCVTY